MNFEFKNNLQEVALKTKYGASKAMYVTKEGFNSITQNKDVKYRILSNAGTATSISAAVYGVGKFLENKSKETLFKAGSLEVVKQGSLSSLKYFLGAAVVVGIIVTTVSEGLLSGASEKYDKKYQAAQDAALAEIRKIIEAKKAEKAKKASEVSEASEAIEADED